MDRIVLTHLSGSKENQEDIFPLGEFKEIIFGRDPSSSVKFNEETETMVGRQHARITRNVAFPSQFFITDLNSRNGTFVNGQRVFGTIILAPGDVVQCGVGGPEFRFSVEPETDRLASGKPPAPTANLLERAGGQPARRDRPLAASAGAIAAPAGEARVEPSQAPAGREGRSSRRLMVGGASVIALLALVAGFLFYRTLKSSGSSGTGNPGTPTPQVVPTNPEVEKYGHVHLSGGAAAESEKDAERAAWRIEVAPYLTLGSGRPGAGASDFDKPDGIALSPSGLLFAADAGNRRVQVWDVKTGERLAEFGRGIFGGRIADIAIAPDNLILVTDRTRNLVYAFAPPAPGALDENGKPLGPYDYQFKGERFGQQGFEKLDGVAVDSRGRVYLADEQLDDVRRFNPDGAPDKTWKFERARADGEAFSRGGGVIAIDETAGNLFIASRKHAVIEVFDWETGAYKNQLIGAAKDAAGRPAGKSVFFGAVEGLAIAERHLLAVDESAGHIQVFDLARPDAFNTDLAGYAAPQPNARAGYRGFFGHAPKVDFEDRTNTELQQRVKAGSVIPGQANPPGYFCSPGSIASYADRASGETYVAISDQGNHRIVVYRWSSVAKAMGAAAAPAGTTLAANKAGAGNKTAPPAPPKVAPAASNRNRITRPIAGKVPIRGGRPIASKNREKIKSGDRALEEKRAKEAKKRREKAAKEAEKARKEKRVRERP
jgi:hypothetical protein